MTDDRPPEAADSVERAYEAPVVAPIGSTSELTSQPDNLTSVLDEKTVST